MKQKLIHLLRSMRFGTVAQLLEAHQHGSQEPVKITEERKTNCRT
jgi:hypothetical protein